jgi:2-oxoisovalerate dehydrogenase E1 component
VYDTISGLAESIRKNPRPILLECITFRMRGHEEASGVKYVPQELFEIWGKKDPVVNYERYLLEQQVLTYDLINEIRAEIKSPPRANRRQRATTHRANLFLWLRF